MNTLSPRPRRTAPRRAAVPPREEARRRGSALVTSVVLLGIVATAVASLTTLSLASYRGAYRSIWERQAFYHAENAMLEGIQRVAETEREVFVGTYSLAANNLFGAYTPGAELDAATLVIEDVLDALGQPTDFFQVTATATVSDTLRTVSALVRKNPPSLVFDYEYFLNNWGWWWGASITGNGANRSNWDFDFRHKPVVNGHTYANGDVESNQVPIDVFADGSATVGGVAGTDPLTYLHTGVPRVQMPNLLDFSHYATKATEQLAAGEGGTLKQGATTLVAAVHSNATDKRGIYLEGTSANPIIIDGTVVIHGDVIIKGVVQGQGTLYVGGNLYLAGDVTYKNGPSFATPPATMTPENRDAWVAANKNKDLVAFAVREAVYGGKVNDSDWKTRCYDASVYGLKNVGAENKLGADGIAGTPDDNIPFRDTNNDGTPDSTWNDVDADGVMDANYNYTNQIQMTDTRRNKIDRYPTSGASKIDYNTVATDQIAKIEGLFYTNHAFAVRSKKSGFIGNGSIICRDEAVIFTGSLKFNYDERVHSRYNDDPNSIVDLGLPVAERVRIITRRELTPTGQVMNG